MHQNGLANGLCPEQLRSFKTLSETAKLDLGHRLGPQRPASDIGHIHTYLFDSGYT